MINRATPLLAQIAKAKVLVVGDLVADEYVFGQTERVSREAPVLVVRHEHDEVKLGGAANAAANASALGAQVTAVGVLGKDSRGQALRRGFAQASIDFSGVISGSVQTETKTRVLAGGAGTQRQQMLRVDRGNATPLPAAVRTKLAQALERAIGSCDVVLVSDYGGGVLGDETRDVLRQAWQAGKKVCVDSRYALSAYYGATVCKPNEPELAAVTGLPVDTDAQLLVAGQEALSTLACEVLLVTRGRRGMAVLQKNAPHALIPVWGPRDALDVTGAGDTVNAVFASALATGAKPVDAARLANVAGALVVQKRGTATVSAAELKHAVEATW
ncbi:MAG: bifunctional hydroxymethylpyrimidine kinase/phosphomethylpyrimidine kinase [Myxococcaceae bacterium]|nr:bifunctional hydroxymethylpyrimidine kinase/phosphomethylpyrimidine kinase [Myxococcaceae bacterium]